MRGKGFGRILNEYAEDFLRKAGFRRIRLSVTDSNSTALNFYKKMSWRELGPSPKRPGVLLMEKNLAT
jgi:ribosomal protein S18 acetylase RimI-like enzyme